VSLLSFAAFVVFFAFFASKIFGFLDPGGLATLPERVLRAAHVQVSSTLKSGAVLRRIPRHNMNDSPLDPFKDILGIDVTPERLQENLAAYRSILAEIQKLRELDLTDIHPAVIFEPTAVWRKEPGK